jgi:hypothetical protein
MRTPKLAQSLLLRTASFLQCHSNELATTATTTTSPVPYVIFPSSQIYGALIAINKKKENCTTQVIDIHPFVLVGGGG